MGVTPRPSVPSPGAARPEEAGRWTVLAVLCISLLIVTLDNTVLNVALPTLARDLNASSTNDLQWIVDAYSLVFGGLLLVSGSLADRLGRKWAFLAGLVIFAAGSAWAAFSGSVSLLIAARASMGVGASLIMPSTLSIITDAFRDAAERQRAIAFWSATSGVGIALGPIVGGLLLNHFWWGSVFLVNVPIAAVGLAFSTWLVPNSKNPRAQRADFVGGLLSTLGLGALLWGIIEGPVHGWGSGRVLGVGGAGLAILVAFVLWERFTSHPMLRLDFFRRRSFSAAVFCLAPTMFALFGGLFVLTQFLQFKLGYTPLAAGVRQLPTAGAIAVCSPLTAPLVRVLGTKATATAGLLAIAVGFFQISRVSASSGYADIVAGMVLVGVGAGLILPTVTASVMGSLPREHTGVGSGTNGTFLQVGGALGVAVIGSLLSTRYGDRMRTWLAPHHLPGPVRKALTDSISAAQQVARHLPGPQAARALRLARHAFVAGMELGLLVGALVAAVAAVIALAALPVRANPEGPPPSAEGERGPEGPREPRGPGAGDRGSGGAPDPGGTGRPARPGGTDGAGGTHGGGADRTG